MMGNDLKLSTFLEGFKKQDIAILSRAITLVESKKPEHQKLARELLDKLYPLTGKAKRIGISGTPGVGKSTFIESFGLKLIEQGLRPAILTIDPTSQKTGGSILGDKTRMQKLSTSFDAYIRPAPSGKTLGGVASKTRESMLLCEAFGFDVIVIETVGVGQSEVTVSQMVDFFLLLMQPGGGDDLQGIKRGILEVADLVAVNKADGEQLRQAQIAQQEYSQALRILHQDQLWCPQVIKCSALKGTGIDEIWQLIQDFYEVTKDILQQKRDQQLKKWLWSLVIEKVQFELEHDNKLKNTLINTQKQLLQHKINIMDATEMIYKTLTHYTSHSPSDD